MFSYIGKYSLFAMSIFYINSIKPSQATGTVKEVYGQLKSEMGDVVEPISLHALTPDLLKGIWGILRETVVVEDKVKRTVKEAVGAAVSASNDCPYCVDAHTIMILGLKDKVVANAILKKKPDIIPDESTRKIVDWSFETRNFDSEIIKNPPFSKEKAPEIIGTAVFFHYLNRMVTIFLGPTILPMNVSFLKGVMKAMAAKMFSGVLQKEKKPGEVKGDMVVSPDFPWSTNSSRISYMFSYFQHVLGSFSEKNIPEEVQAFMKVQIENWNGEDMPNSNEKLDLIMSNLSEENHLMAKMLYLTAFSPHRLRHHHFEDFKLSYAASDDYLLSMLAWSSFSIATKIGHVLGKKFT